MPPVYVINIIIITATCNRKRDLYLAYNCPYDKVYAAVMSPCQPTCSDATAPLKCTYSTREGCVCPQGQLEHEDGCVDADICGCRDNSGYHIAVRYKQILYCVFKLTLAVIK